MDVLSIHSALRLACSQDPNKLKTGEQQLKSWEKEKGYYAGLAVSMTVTSIYFSHCRVYLVIEMLILLFVGWPLHV